MVLLWDNVEKYCRAEQATDENMAHAHCNLDTWGYKHTLTICNSYCFSTPTVVAWRRLKLRYTYSTLPVSSYLKKLLYSIACTSIRKHITLSQSVSFSLYDADSKHHYFPKSIKWLAAVTENRCANGEAGSTFLSSLEFRRPILNCNSACTQA